MTRTIIAIDGPAGAGKSTVARMVANTLGLAHIDTGATYRLLALRALAEDIPLDDPQGAADLAERLRTDTTLNDSALTFRGQPVGDEIRTPEVTHAASIVAAHPEVRAVLVQLQRALVPPSGAVVEGRDIGTVVWPNAAVKAYLDARPEVRAQRRADNASSDRGADEAISERDRRDSTRPVGAMRPAPDALLIDTSDRRADDVATQIVSALKARTAPAPAPSRERMPPFYRFCRAGLKLMLKLFRFEVVGAERIPTSGAAILAPNHRSLIDIFVAGAVTDRQVWFMAKEELMRTKIGAFLLGRLGAFAVHRGRPDRTSLNRALHLLETGHLLGVFPEGTRKPDSRFEELEEGFSYLALKTGALVVPMAISGAEAVFPPGKKFPRFVKIRALIGEPFSLGGPAPGVLPRSKVREATAEASRRFQAVMNDLEPR